MKKLKFILILLIIITFFTLCTGCSIYNNYQAVVISQDRNILYIYNIGSLKNDSKYNKINLYDDVEEKHVSEIIQTKFEPGDFIKIKGLSEGGWNNITSIKVVSYNNPIPDYKNK